MRFIPTRAHGVLDYLTSGVLIAAPTLLRFGRGGAKSWVPVALGVGTIVYSLLTDYELGAVKVMPMPVHLGLDTANGVLLASSPWLFGFADEVWAPHLALGLFEIGAAKFSQTKPSYEAGNALGLAS